MKLILERSYHAEGTNGTLYAGNEMVCHTIELPWRNNATGISCIPEGVYKVIKRFSERHKHHLHLPDVAHRELILIHKANDALQELRGCIAPVVTLTGPGTGYPSKPAFSKLYHLIDTALKGGETVELVICCKN